MTLYFPRGELDRAGRTVLYQLRRPDDSGAVRYAADCAVPYTEGALRRVDRTFGVTGGAEQFAARRDMMTTQGCVGDKTECALEPILVRAPLKPNTDPDDPCTRYPDQCEHGGGGTDGGEGWGGTGWPADDNGDLPPAPGDDSDEDETPPDCTNPLSEKQVAYCNGYVPTGALLTRIQEALNAFKTRGAACADLAAKGEALLQAGTFKVTNNTYPGWAAAAARPGDWVIFTRGLLDYPNAKYVDAMIAHELDHSQDNTFPGVWTDADGHALNPDGTTDPYHTANSKSCAGMT